MPHRKPERIIAKLIEQFKALRLAHSMSHEELARKSGVTRPAISHIEGGKRKPSLLMSLKLAQGLGKELSAMLLEAEGAETKK